ncbi:MAG: GntR family transcriptional regulator [Allobaculum sp.]
MELHISTTSMVPIYEQIADQIRKQISTGSLGAGELVPSVRTCAKNYHISALTVKKAYDLLEGEGFVTTVHGKGTYVAAISPALVEEEMQKQLEAAFDLAISKARGMKYTNEEILGLVSTLLEDSND